MWILFAFSGPILWALSTHIDKYLVEKYFKNSDVTVLMVFTSLIGAAGLPVIWYFDRDVLAPDATGIAVMTASGVLYMGAMLLYLRALQTEEASVIAPLFQANAIFTFLLGYLILDEKLTWLQLAGGALIIGGVLVLSLDARLSLGKFKLRLVLLMAAATFALALSSVLFKLFAVRDEFWTTTFWTFAGESIFGVAILAVPTYRRQFAHLFRKNPGAVMGVNGANELINLGGGIGVRYASLSAPVALVTAISSTVTLFVFAFGILISLLLPKFGREDLSRKNLIKKGAGAIFVAAGVTLINL